MHFRINTSLFYKREYYDLRPYNNPTVTVSSKPKDKEIRSVIFIAFYYFQKEEIIIRVKISFYEIQLSTDRLLPQHLPQIQQIFLEKRTQILLFIE